MAYINGGGMCLKWLRDDILNKAYSYDELNKMAAEIPAGSENLLFLPHFSGRVCPNDTLTRGSYINLGWQHTKAHMYRAIMEGIAYEYGIYTDIIRNLSSDLKLERIISVGGGSNSHVFGQIKADVLGVPVSTIKLADTATLACAVIAGYGVGLYDDMVSQIERLSTIQSTITPNPNLYDKYKKLHSIYAGIFEDLHETYYKLAMIN